MIINKIKFKNFMAYYKDVEFSFPLNDDKNVSIIYAPNDVGKSCFFKGIKFALYGTKRGQSEKELINVNALNEKDYEAYVSIVAEHNNKSIEITRKIETRGKVSDDPRDHDFTNHLDIKEDNDILAFDEFAEKYDYINSIVHEEAAKYFFFDGEKIDAYNIANGADYKQAITRILGLKEIENGKEDFDKLEGEYEKERDKLLQKQEKADKILNKKRDIEDEINDLNQDLEDYEKELKNIKSRIIKLEEELKDHEDVKQQVEEKQRLRKHKEELEEEIIEYENKKQQIFRDNGTIILGCEIANKIKRKSDFEDYNKVVMTEDIKSFLKNLAEDDECICGNSIGEQEKNNINDYISTKLEEMEGTENQLEKQREFRKIDKYLNHGAESKQRFLNVCMEKVNKQRELSHIKKDLLELKGEIGDFNEETAEINNQEISQLEEKQKNIENKIIETQTLIKTKKEELEDQEKELNKFSSTDKEAALADKKLKMAKKIKNVFKDYLEALTKVKKQEVQENSTDIFLQLTNKPHKYKGLIITDDYDLRIQLSDESQYVIKPGNPRNPSTGQSKIISLSYIAGINQSSNSAAPIVVDNPIGLFSDEHRERVMEYLPKFGRQVIFMVTTADLNQKYKKIIQPYVNCEYYLEDDSQQTWNKTVIADKEVY